MKDDFFFLFSRIVGEFLRYNYYYSNLNASSRYVMRFHENFKKVLKKKKEKQFMIYNFSYSKYGKIYF